MKIGLFICDCGKNISGVIDNKKLIEYFKKIPDIYVLGDQYLCSELGLNKIVEEIQERRIDRVVIAACSFNLHGLLFDCNFHLLRYLSYFHQLFSLIL